MPSRPAAPLPPSHRRSFRAQAAGAGPDRPAGTLPRPRSRRRGAVRPETARAQLVGSPPRPDPRHAQGQIVQPYRYDGSPLAAFLYLCAALGAAVLLWLCNSPPPPSYGYRGLPAAVVAALVVILFRRHPPGVDQDLPETPDPDQIVAAPAPQLKQPRLALTGSVLDEDRVAAAIRSCMTNITRPFLAVTPPRAHSSDSDGGGRSSSDGDEVTNYLYTPVHLLDAGGARLVVPGFIQQLREMVRGLEDQADAAELLRRAFRDARKSDAFSYRLFDVVQNQCVICADPHGLTDRTTGTLMMTMKVTAKLLHLIWFELDRQNWLCQRVKNECFREIVGQSVQKLLDIALSLSNGRLSADHPLTTLDALVDVLYSIIDLPLSRTEFIPNEVADILDLPLNIYEPIHNVVAHIFCKIVVDFRGMLEAARAESIHRATGLLVRYLEFFYRNGEMMQSVLGTGDCAIELAMISSWVCKLARDAEIMFPANIVHVKGRRYIFVLNNISCVYAMRFHPGGFLSDVEQSLRSLLNQYIRSYLEEYWDPLVRHLDADSLTTPSPSSLHNFLQEFFSICDIQMTWQVGTAELKEMLRTEILDLIIPIYENFLRILQEEHPGSCCPCWSMGSEQPMYTAAWLKRNISLFLEG